MVIAVVIAVPIGIFVGRRPREQALWSRSLDALQTLPSLIYAIPFVMIFAVGYVPGILATVLYAIPPGIRLTALAIKQVNPETLEAASTFGATNRQRLWGVHVPLALKGIALGVNQLIMMSMSMMIIAGLVGGGGLGFEAVSALIKQDSGHGAEVERRHPGDGDHPRSPQRGIRREDGSGLGRPRSLITARSLITPPLITGRPLITVHPGRTVRWQDRT